MKFFLIFFTVVGAVIADVSQFPPNGYLPPVQEATPIDIPKLDYLPPVEQQVPTFGPTPVEPVPAHELTQDGYRYKTHRRIVYRRHRRDVSHLPSNEYLPPVQEHVPAAIPNNEYLPPVQQQVPIAPLPPVEPVPAHELASDGYRYKTRRRVVYRRRRRDVSHLPSNDYLPPVQETTPIEVAPVQEVSNAVIEEAAPAHEFAPDGYHYKTQRRVVYRLNRRDVSELPSNEYLPPTQEATPVEYTTDQQISNVLDTEPAPAHELTDNGYRYKTQRRVVYRRNRRDVSHLVSNEYLPPAEEVIPVVPVEETPVVVNVVDDAIPAHELTDDGYHYKTHRRVVYRRNRRDVSHLPSNEYLPPINEVSPVVTPTSEYLPPAQQYEPVPAHELSQDGYRYKSHRRVIYRRH